jgi:hypothetical protein
MDDNYITQATVSVSDEGLLLINNSGLGSCKFRGESYVCQALVVNHPSHHTIEGVQADGEVDLVDVEAADVETDLHPRAVSGADYTAAEATAEVSLKTGAGFDVAVAITEDVSELIDLRIEIDSVANPEATSDTRFKKVRKAEAMETAAAKPLAVPEKKRRVDGVFLVESEAGPSNETAATPRPSNWETTESRGTAAAESLAVPEEKMRAEGALLVESEADLSSETAATPRPSNWATLTPSQKANWRRWNRRRNK